MKARLSLAAAVVALMAYPAFAQEPPPAASEQAPAAQTEPAPAPAPAAPTESAAPQATEPAPAPMPPSVDKQAAVPAPSTGVAAADLKKTEDDNKMVAPLNSSVDAVEEMNLLDANGKKIGEVDEVLEDSNGEIKAIAIGYGGFLGFGEKGAIITLDQVRLKDGNLVTELTEEQLGQQPEWKD